MARLPNVKFKFVSSAGDVLEFVSEVSVDGEGLFGVTAPDELEDTLRGVVKARAQEGLSAYRAAKNLRIYGPTLQACKDTIIRAGKEFVSCEITTEKVILYNSETSVCYSKTDNGVICPNGYSPDGAPSQHCGTLHAANHDRFYRVGFAAVVMDKVTHKSSSNTKIEFKRAADQGGMHCYPETYHDKLNAFCGLNIHPPSMKEIPYTEEAAKFFYEIMIAMCSLADRLTGFIGDDDRVKLAIEAKQTFFALPEKTAA